jgi:hypothetical protein
MHPRLLASTLAVLLAAPLGALSLAHPTAAPMPAPEGAPAASASAPMDTLVVDASAMPEGNGWLLGTIHAAHDAAVAFRVALRGEGPPPVAAMDFLGTSVQNLPAVGMFDAESGDLADVNHGGRVLACCDALQSFGISGFGGGTSSGNGTLRVHAGDAIYVGLLAAGWTGASSFRASFVAPHGALQLDPVATGGGVRFVNLLEEARKQGTNLEAGSQVLAGSSGAARVAFEARQTGLLFVGYGFVGSASARLDVAVPDGTTANDGAGRNVGGVVLAATDPGTSTITVRDVHDPPLVPMPGDGPQMGFATAIFADMPLPMHGFRSAIHPS